MTDFIVALFKMTGEQLANASAERAAERFGIRADWAGYYITQERQSR